VGLRIAKGPVMPMTWGLLRPRILLPAGHTQWDLERSRGVLLHELGHVARNDSASRAAAAALCAVYWVNPMSWLAAERMRREQEHACDDLVLSRGAEAASYARNLLAAARAMQAPGRAAAPAAAIVRRSELERRLVAIVGDVPRSRAGRLFSVAATLVT